jgi:localization factor PodJL
MKIGVPWKVKGIRPDARETAREAARRAGMSLGEWLNSVIIDSAVEEGVRVRGRGEVEDEDSDDQDLTLVHERLDELTRHLQRVTAPVAPKPQSPRNNFDPDRQHLADAIARLDRRVEQLVNRPAPYQAPAAYQAPAPSHISQAPAAYNIAPPAPHYWAPTPPSYQAPAPVKVSQPAPAPIVPAPARVYQAPVADNGVERRPSPSMHWPSAIEQALAEITARQQALEADPEALAPWPLPIHTPEPPSTAAVPSPAPPLPIYPDAPPIMAEPPITVAPPAPPPPPAQNLSGLEQQLRQITTQIEALRQPSGLEEGIAALRGQLNEIARTLTEAMPRRAIEAIETEIRTLAGRLDSTRSAGVDGPALSAVERGLVEVRDALRVLTPAENLVGFHEAVRGLSQKVDLLASTSQDPAAFQQLEAAISTLRGILSHVASNEALVQLAGEVRELSAKIDQVASSANGDALTALEKRIGHIADALEKRSQNGGMVPPQLEAVIKGLSDKIERIQSSRGDDVSLGNLEDRIVKLVEKLDASGARFSQLEAIEKGLADLLAQTETQRAAGGAATANPQPAVNVDALQRDIARTQNSLESVHGTLGQVVDRLAMIETGIRSASAPRPAMPQAAPTPQSASSPPAASLPQAPQLPQGASSPQAGLPPTTTSPQTAALPLSAMRFPTPPAASPPPNAPDRATAAAAAAAAMARANPQAARRPIDPNLPPDQPLEPNSGGNRARKVASPADRIAASEADLGRAKPPVIADPGGKSNFIAAARRAAQAAAAEPSASDLRAVADDQNENTEPARKTIAHRVRSLFVGASVILIAAGVWRFAPSLTDSTDSPKPPSIARAQTKPAPASPKATDIAALATPQIGPAVAPKVPAAARPASEITGSVQSGSPSWMQQQAPSMPAIAATRPVGADKLPASIGAPLRTAAAGGNAAAQYEIGMRYAEGRGVSASFQEAARWLEYAAKQGLPPAQFRLGGLYEKGTGVKKDLDMARELYRAAADRGHAKAMHNLAVLYAEGAATKPDYRSAAQWFRKASDYGISDSQYNLAILYARGIGTEQNLTESYKWFALAAAQGDQEATKKRDEVGGRLDPASLAAARLAVQAFTAQPQPEEAIAVASPPGGWDGAAASTPAPKPKTRAASADKVGGM